MARVGCYSALQVHIRFVSGSKQLLVAPHDIASRSQPVGGPESLIDLSFNVRTIEYIRACFNVSIYSPYIANATNPVLWNLGAGRLVRYKFRNNSESYNLEKCVALDAGRVQLAPPHTSPHRPR